MIQFKSDEDNLDINVKMMDTGNLEDVINTFVGFLIAGGWSMKGIKKILIETGELMESDSI